MDNELIVVVADKAIVNYERRMITHGYEICHTTHEKQPMNF